MELDSSQIVELVSFLNDKNPKVKLETLGVILQFSGTKEQRELFKDTDLMKLVLRLHPEEEFTERAISILINFTQDDIYRKAILELKGVNRIIETLKEQLIKHNNLISKNMSKGQLGLQEEDLKVQESEKVFSEDQFILIVQLELLFLSNLSLDIEAREQILEFHREEDFHGLHFSFMLNWFSHPKISPIFHFFANVLANITSDKRCREFVLNPKVKLFDHISPSIYAAEPNRRLGTLKTLRNCFFEYENEDVVSYILSPENKVLESLIKCLAFVLTQTLGVVVGAEKDYQDAKDLCKTLKIDPFAIDDVPNLGQSLEEIDIIIDLFMVLTNLDPEKYKIEIDEDVFRTLLNYIPKVTSREELKNKIDVIKVLILKENTMM